MGLEEELREPSFFEKFGAGLKGAFLGFASGFRPWFGEKPGILKKIKRGVAFGALGFGLCYALGCDAKFNPEYSAAPNNHAPVMLSLSDIEITEGDYVDVSGAVEAAASDPDGDALNIIYPAPLDSNGAWQTGFYDAGTYNLPIIAEDGKGGQATQNQRIVVYDDNRQPTLDVIADVTVNEGALIDINPTATDPDMDNILNFTFTPPLDSNGEWQTGYTDAGTYQSTVTVDDGHGGTDFQVVNITINNVNGPPVIDTPIPPVTGDEGTTIYVNATATDPDLDPVTITYSSGTLPVDPNTGQIDLDYTHAAGSPHTVTAHADDGNGGTDDEDVTVIVNDVNRDPVLGALTAIVVNEMDLIQATATATDPDGDTVTITFGPPLDPNGEWQTDYNSAGTYQSTVTATDGKGGIDTDILDVTVINVNRPPVLDPIAPITVNEGELVVVNATYNDPDGDTVDLSYSVPLDANGQWQTLSGDAGQYVATVTADDGNGGIDTEQVAITVEELYLIVFESWRDGNGEIYKRLSDGSGLERLTNNAVDDMYPTLSRDGTQIAFMRDCGGGNYDVWIMQIDGSGQTNVTDSSGTWDGMPSFDPTGTQLVFSSLEGDYELFTINTDGTNRQKITNNAYNDLYPAWSPDGTQIACTRYLTSTNGEIYLINIPGPGETRLTNNALDDWASHWDPTSSTLTFMSERSGFSRVYTMERSGANQTMVTSGTAWEDHPSFSPGGTRIVYASDASGLNIDIWDIRPDGTDERRQTTDPGVDTNPSGS
ncbi:hypothetical protein KY329_01045 [Candidatus Woesearchaeota archaeon]|nr:hypothetical protein [Candidatus Woesearchaeota archaeon]